MKAGPYSIGSDRWPGISKLTEEAGEVTQTRTGRPAGNCTEAAIASILEVPLEAVPDLFDPEADPEAEGWRDHRWKVVHDWLLAEHGMKYVQIRRPPSEALPIIAQGIGEERMRTTHHLLMGKNPDGVGHAVVALAGEVVWDPNPRRRGITDPDEVVFLLPADLFPPECREWPGLDYTPRT